MKVEDAQAAKQAFDKVSGLADDHEEEISYVKTMLTDWKSTLGAVGSVMLGGLILGGGLLLGGTILVAIAAAVFPGLGYLLTQTLRLIFVPGSVGYQGKVQKDKRQERRDRTRQLLLGKLADPYTVKQESRVSDPFLAAFVSRQTDLMKIEWRMGLEEFRGTYLRMLERLEALKEMAEKTETSLSEFDIEKLEESTNDYLRLVFAKLNITSRLEGDKDDAIQEKIDAIDASMDGTTSQVVQKKLAKSKGQLERILARRAQLPGRDAVISAQLMAMGETFEELYHQVSSDPSGAGISDFLSEATERLSVEEELTLSVADEMESVSGGMDEFTKKRMAAVAAKAKALQGQG